MYFASRSYALHLKDSLRYSISRIRFDSTWGGGERQLPAFKVQASFTKDPMKGGGLGGGGWRMRI